MVALLRVAVVAAVVAASAMVTASVVAPVSASAAGPPAGTLTSFPLDATLPAGKVDIAVGSDGALWVTVPKPAGATSSIRRMSTDGTVTTFTDPDIRFPTSIAAGPDGALWFTDTVTNAIGRITTAGSVSSFSKLGIDVDHIIAGPDGAMWFGSPDTFPGTIGRITMDGVMTEVALPPATYVVDLTVGPDAAIWYVGVRYAHDGNEYSIGRVTTNGVVTVVATPRLTYPTSITAGPDGALWVADGIKGSLERVATDGDITSFVRPGLWAASDVTAGPDGALWVTTFEGQLVGRMTTGGDFSSFGSGETDIGYAITAGPGGALWFTASSPSAAFVNRIQALGPPSPPQSVAAIAGTGSATVTWSPPGADGGSPVTGYTVTATPGGATCSWVAGPRTCVVSGLSTTGSYEFFVTATTAQGEGTASQLSNTVRPRAGAGYHPIAPTRVLDSRTTTGGWSGPLRAGFNGRPLVLDPAVVPASATAVIMNVTVTGSTDPSYLSVWPAGAERRPDSSSLNFAPSQTIANQVTVEVGSGHAVQFATAGGQTDVVADVVGWFDDGSGGAGGGGGGAGGWYHAITPTRALDSRLDPGPWAGPLTAGSPRDLALPMVPADATAVIANITVTGSTADSYLTVWPTGIAQPGISNLNFATGQTIPNLAVVPLGVDHKIRFATNTGSTDVVVDVAGWFSPTAGGKFHAVFPVRVLDDRFGVGLLGPWGNDESRTLTIVPPMPADATGLVANVTATNPTAGSFVTIFPAGQPLPTASNLNFGPGITIPNLVMTPIGTDHGVALHNTWGTVDLVADAVGYYAPT